MTVARLLVTVACLRLVAACSSSAGSGQTPTDADGGAESHGPTGAAGQPPSGSSACIAGCTQTLAAQCKNGPVDQASCERDCQALQAGKCGADYAKLQSCAEGKQVACSAQGLPVVSACADEQAAFVACLSG